MKPATVAIIGAGSVGTITAFTFMMKNFPCNIILVDTNKERCLGEVKDLSDAQAFCSLSSIHVGSAQDAQQADIIIIAAGKRQSPGQSRLDLLHDNIKIMNDIISSLKPISPQAIIIMVTNPVDILTHYVVDNCGLPQHQIMGSGTLLETHRLFKFLAQRLGISEKSIHGYVIGEHGENAFAAMQTIMADGKTLQDWNLKTTDLDKVEQQAKQEADEIIKCKGATFFGVATCVAQLCEAIMFDQNKVLPVSCYVDKLKTCLSIPVIINKNGIQKEMELPLTDKQQQILMTTAQKLNRLYENAIATLT